MSASTKDVKTRIRSVESTRQITKAMGLVASSKLRRAKDRMDSSRDYFTAMRDTVGDIAAKMDPRSSVFAARHDIKKICYIVIAGDRGLAGGYNNTIFKLTSEMMTDKNACVVPLGKRALEYFSAHDFEIFTSEYATVESLGRSECASLARYLCKAFRDRKYDALYLVYTKFNTMLSQTPQSFRLLPLEVPEDADKDTGFVLYEPGIEAVFDAIIPEYLTGILYGAVAESYCSELTARRNAMDAAGKNADEMLEKLNLDYNRARQGAITQEITEIIAGSENE